MTVPPAHAYCAWCGRLAPVGFPAANQEGWCTMTIGGYASDGARLLCARLVSADPADLRGLALHEAIVDGCAAAARVERRVRRMDGT